MVLGGSYGLGLPMWGFLCDLKVQFQFQKFSCPISHFLPMQVLKNSSKLVMGIGALLIVVGFMIMGQSIQNGCFLQYFNLL